MLLRSRHLLRGSVGGCLFGACKPFSPALSFVGSYATSPLRVPSIYNRDEPYHEKGFTPFLATGLVLSFGTSVSACTGSDEETADVPKPVSSVPPKLVQHNIRDFFSVSTPESRAAATALAAQQIIPPKVPNLLLRARELSSSPRSNHE